MISLFDSPLYSPLFGDMEIAAVLGDEAFVTRMIEAEAALARACDKAGVVATGSGPSLSEKLADMRIDPAALGQGLASAGVPVPALVAQLKAELGEAGNALHWGATSQDIVDLATVLQWREALSKLGARVSRLLDSLEAESNRFADQPLAARTRSQSATPISLGLRIAEWAQPLISAEQSLPVVELDLMKSQLGGASGSLSALGADGTKVAEALAAELHLEAAPVWHTDRSAVLGLGQWLVQVGAALGKMARDLIVMGRSEAGELRAGKGGGSSTMPHKSNPVSPEAIVTLTDYVAILQPALSRAASPLEERDGAVWALEWMVLPQMGVAIAAALRHAMVLSESLRPDVDNLGKPFEAHGGAMMSEAATFALAEHMPRAEASDKVKTLLKQAVAEGTTLAKVLANAPDTAGLCDWESRLAPAQALAPAEEMRQRILKRRAS